MEKFLRVKSFFENELYLQNRVNIEIRKVIVDELFSEIKGKVILDMGCGDGSVSLHLCQNNELVLVDGSSYMIQRAMEKAPKQCQSIEFFQEDILQFRYQKKFDIVLCIGVISHIQDANELMTKIKDLLKPNGKVIIQFSDTDHFVYRLKRKFGSPDNYGYKLNSFSTDSFMQFLKASGFRFLTKKGYSWQHVPINRLPFRLQFNLIKMARNIFPLSMFNSEWLVLLEMSDMDEK